MDDFNNAFEASLVAWSLTESVEEHDEVLDLCVMLSLMFEPDDLPVDQAYLDITQLEAFYERDDRPFDD